MNLLLAESCPSVQEKIKSLVKTFFPHWNIPVAVATVRELGSILSDQSAFDLILSEIDLPDGSSFSVFEKLKLEVPVIFFSNSEGSAFKSFDFFCLDYLVKPLSEGRLICAFEKFLRFSKSQPELFSSGRMKEETHFKENRVFYKKRFLSRSGNRLCFVPADSVTYFYAEEGVTFLMESGSSQRHIVDHSLNELEKNLLDPDKFYRINRSVIINLDYMIEMRPYLNGRLAVSLNVKSEDLLIVAREKVSDFKVWINQ